MVDLAMTAHEVGSGKNTAGDILFVPKQTIPRVVTEVSYVPKVHIVPHFQRLTCDALPDRHCIRTSNFRAHFELQQK